VAPFWFTPHAAGPREYGFHWLVTLVANCFLLAGLAFGGYMALTQLRRPQARVGAADGTAGTGGVSVTSEVGVEAPR
jgi:alpha-1,2-mannosyltransferase